MNSKKIIGHIDIDSFFVSAARVIKPWLNNSPLAISYNKNNSIVTSVSYEARAKGAKAAQTLSEVKRLVPNIKVENPDYKLYGILSAKFFDFIRKEITDEIEILSIDECFLDLSKYASKFNNLEEMGIDIKNKIFKNLKLPVSIGISESKFLAKMATNKAKPFGVKVINTTEMKTVIFPLNVKEYFGIGKSSVEKLYEMNIFTIGDLYQKGEYDLQLRKIFGRRIRDIFSNLNGTGNNTIISQQEEIKIISNFITFPNGRIDERRELVKYLKLIAQKIERRCSKRRLLGKRIVLQFSFAYGEMIQRSKKISKPTNNWEEIFNTSLALFDQHWQEKSVRGIGLGIGDLIAQEKNDFNQTLFNDSYKSKEKSIIDLINNKFNKEVLKSAKQYQEDKNKLKGYVKFLEEEHTSKK